MKKLSRERGLIAKYFVIQSLFRLLDHLADKKNHYASIIYKKITFSFIGNIIIKIFLKKIS